jgi:hypothetical protein
MVSPAGGISFAIRLVIFSLASLSSALFAQQKPIWKAEKPKDETAPASR